ncbi:hypothetical protein PI124_g17223 [Phytophthora idaei]|nr:hypothetical protein PI125_g12459 [Phytophthora idaei]KAG3139818.1 hypothetical protein PI126_g16284 [Phytophthora idaei]KAG3237798.1 hypothetical protein PI124_g17223 [Phytophthora idaei]
MAPQAPRGIDIWAVEGIARSIFFYLDLSTFDAVLHFIQATPELREYLKDGTLWGQLSKKHFGGSRVAELAIEMIPIESRGWDWTSRERTCVQLQEFLQSIDDRTRFDEVVTVVAGDIQSIKDIDGQPLDGIAFPTNPHLTNHHVGAAAAVFERAGPGLKAFVSDPSFRGVRPVGSAVVTPAFGAGVDKLIHCVGPSINMRHCYELLHTTYKSALEAMLREGLQCVVMASVSTGSLGIPPEEGGRVAMRAIQEFLVGSGWRGKLVIVCKEENVLQAFQVGKSAVLDDFNLVPPLPAGDQWLF